MLNEQGNLVFKCNGFPDSELTLPLDWLQDPYNNITWRWNLHCLPMLGDALKQDEPRKHAKFMTDIASSWIEKFRGTYPSNLYPRFCWGDHATALRALAFCELRKFARANRDLFTDDFLNDLHATLEEHADLLAKPEFYSRNTNHGMDQAISLMGLGDTLEDVSLKELGKTRFLSELDFAFTEDGIHKENSPGYHFSVLLRFAGAYEKYQDAFAEIRDKFLKTCNGALLYLAYITRPDAKICIIGDSQLGTCPPDAMPEFLRGLENYKYFLYSVTGGKQGSPLPEPHKVFAKSGYAVFRDAGKDSPGLHLVMKAGAMSNYHYHADEGNILLYAFGEDWIIDSGHFNYMEDNPVRKLLRSRYGHNVPVAPEMAYSDNPRHKFGAWKINSFSKQKDNAWLECAHDCITGLNMIRRLEYAGKGKLALYDAISGDFGDMKKLEILLHVPANKKINIKNNRIEIASKYKKLNVEIISDNFEHAYVTTGNAGSPQKDSYVSWRFNKCEPSQCIHCVYGTSNGVASSMLLKFI